eukprot:EG_transcript_9447
MASWLLEPTTDTPAAALALLSNISILLCEPQGPQNVGGAARVLQNFGLRDLRVVAPPGGITEQQVLRPGSRAEDVSRTVFCDEARLFARSAGWILRRTEAQGGFPSTPLATADCTLVVGTSVRRRGQGLPFLTPRAAAQRILRHAAGGRVAVLFGNERIGLTNDDLRLAHQCIYIPTQTVDDESHPTSLNLSHALAIVCYELYLASLDAKVVEKLDADVRRPGTTLDTLGRQELAEELLAALRATSVLPIPERLPPGDTSWQRALSRVWRNAVERVLSVGPMERSDTKVLFALARRTAALARLSAADGRGLPLAELLAADFRRAVAAGALPARPTATQARQYLRSAWGLSLTKRELEAVIQAIVPS